MIALLLERFAHEDYGDFFSVALEMEVLLQVWRATRWESRGVHVCCMRGSFIENTMTRLIRQCRHEPQTRHHHMYKYGSAERCVHHCVLFDRALQRHV